MLPTNGQPIENGTMNGHSSRAISTQLPQSVRKVLPREFVTDSSQAQQDALPSNTQGSVRRFVGNCSGAILIVSAPRCHSAFYFSTRPPLHPSPGTLAREVANVSCLHDIIASHYTYNLFSSGTPPQRTSTASMGARGVACHPNRARASTGATIALRLPPSQGGGGGELSLLTQRNSWPSVHVSLMYVVSSNIFHICHTP